MRSVVRASSVGVLSVLGKGAHAGDEDEGGLGQLVKVILVEVADFDVCAAGLADDSLKAEKEEMRQRRRRTGLGPVAVDLLALVGESAELGLGTTRDGPFQVDGELGGDVVSGALAGITYGGRLLDHRGLIPFVTRVVRSASRRSTTVNEAG